MHRTRRVLVVLTALGATLALAGPAGAAGTASFGSVTCHGGTLKAGTYTSIRIAGLCSMPNSGTVTVRGAVTVAGAFNAITPGTLLVGGNVWIQPGGIAGIGCSPAAGCNVTTADRIGGTLYSNGAKALIVHSVAIHGGVNVFGGGGSMNCGSTGLFGGPFFSTFEDNTIGGTAVIKGVHSCWLGFIRNNVAGSVWISGNRMGDPDAMEIVTNRIRGNLGCFNNIPHAQTGDSQGDKNIVSGRKLGECASL